MLLNGVLGLLLLSTLGVGSGAAWSQEPSAPRDSAEQATTTSPLELVEILVDPAQPAAETLCRLTLRLVNRGDRPISALAFEVEIEGRALPVYEKQVFMRLVPPSSDAVDEAEGTSSVYELRLLNFWSSDSQRPAPTDGKLDVRVRLVEAQWVDVGSEEPNTEVWSLADSIPGLPLESTVSLPLAQD